MKSKKVAIPQDNSLDDEALPEGWYHAKLGDIASRITKGATPTSYGYEFQRIGIKFVKIENIINGQISESSLKQFISSEANENQKRSILESGDILFSIAGTIGNVCLVKEENLPANTNQAIAIIRGTSQVFDPNFLQFFLKSRLALDQVTSKARGGAMNNVSLDDVRDIIVAIPPLSEQQRIVARVEAVLAHVNATREHLSRVPLIMKKFRQGVLAAACSGRLTEGWREENPEIKSATIWMEKTEKKSINLQSDLLIPDYLPNLPGSWDYCTVKEISQFIGSGITPKGGREVYVSEGIPFIRSQNVYPDGLRLDDIVFVTEKMHKEMKRTHVSPNDVLLNITGASIGRCTCVPEKFFEANVNQHVCIIRVVSEFLPQYLSIFLTSPIGQKQIFDSQGGVTRQGLNYSQLRAIIIPLPPLAEQHEIVCRVGLLFERADAFDQEVATASRRCERLTQAVLGKAFRGELADSASQGKEIFEISDRIIKEIAFFKKAHSTVFYEGMITDEDIQKLEKIPTNDCTSETKDLFTSILLKYSKLYGKNFQDPLDHLRRFEENNKDPNHRDHICHLFRLWGMGQIFYKHGFSRYFPKFNKKDPEEQRERDFDFVWCLTALYHDIGYATYSKTTGEKHGDCGAKILLECLNEFTKTTGQPWTPHARRAVDAIRLHDVEDAVDVIKDPWSALLIICDELQEFGRNLPAPGKIVRAEIQEMDVCLNLIATPPAMHVNMLYPRNQPTSRNDIDAETADKKKKLNELFEKRIHNLSIKVDCLLV